MKGSVRIIAGSMRGKAIPFLNRKFGDAEITPQKVKGALFSMLGEYLDGKVFIDLYAGSGQIGFEAMSRGASTVVFNEADRARYSFIKDFASQYSSGHSPIILNMGAGAALRYLSERGIKADVIFIDPPYDKAAGEVELYSSIFNDLKKVSILTPEGVAVIQHYSSNELPDSYSGFTRTSLKKYGTTSLSLYAIERESPIQPA